VTDDIRYWDKMLPMQKEYSNLYRGSALTKDLFDLICRSSGIGDPKLEFALEQSDLFTIEEMGSNPVAMRFLQFLIRVAGVKRVLEIGTFIGFSAMSFAQALPEDGEVVTIEAFDKFAVIAKRNIAKNGFDKKITVHTGDAFEVIDTLPKDKLFGLVFIDGNKERYKDYAA
jgi:predicted O-methyltransferase YrrM